MDLQQIEKGFRGTLLVPNITSQVIPLLLILEMRIMWCGHNIDKIIVANLLCRYATRYRLLWRFHDMGIFMLKEAASCRVSGIEPVENLLNSSVE